MSEIEGWKQACFDVVAENHKICQTLDKLRQELLIAIEKVVELDAKLARKDEEINEALKLKRWAENDVQEIGNLLDLMGAPSLQPSGLPYSIIGRLSALTAQIVGESWVAKIKILKAEIAKKDEEIAVLTEKYLRAGSINENLRDDNTFLEHEIADLKGKYPPIPDDFVEDKP
ncbi:MAG: hypothetical protein ABIH92_00410 [Nanoarchaeota archaeon]